MKTTDAQVESTGSAQQPLVPRRRKLLLGAGSAVTVVASLKSGSALAEGLCASPSAFSSIKVTSVASHKPQNLPTCHSHGYWKNKTGSWPVSVNTTVSGAGFSPTSYSSLFNSSTKLLDILNLGGGGYTPYARDLVCAYLDVKAGSVGPYVLEDDVKKMWALVFGNVPYAPGGISWQVSDVRAWLDVMVGNAAL
jgi:hypothetical protein